MANYPGNGNKPLRKSSQANITMMDAPMLLMAAMETRATTAIPAKIANADPDSDNGREG